MKTDAKIWLEIAEAYGTPCMQRTPRQWGLAFSGLCGAFFKGIDATDNRRMHLDGIFKGKLGRDLFLVGGNDQMRSHLAILFSVLSPQDQEEVELYHTPRWLS